MHFKPVTCKVPQERTDLPLKKKPWSPPSPRGHGQGASLPLPRWRPRVLTSVPAGRAGRAWASRTHGAQRQGRPPGRGRARRLPGRARSARARGRPGHRRTRGAAGAARTPGTRRREGEYEAGSCSLSFDFVQKCFFIIFLLLFGYETGFISLRIFILLISHRYRWLNARTVSLFSLLFRF